MHVQIGSVRLPWRSTFLHVLVCFDGARGRRTYLCMCMLSSMPLCPWLLLVLYMYD